MPLSEVSERWKAMDAYDKEHKADIIRECVICRNPTPGSCALPVQIGRKYSHEIAYVCRECANGMFARRGIA